MFFNPLLPDSSLSRPTTHRNRYREQRYQRQKRHLLLFERLEQRWLLAGDPFVLNIVPEPDSPLRTSSVNIDVKFSEPVQGVDADDMLLIGTAAASATVGTPVDLGSDTCGSLLPGWPREC